MEKIKTFGSLFLVMLSCFILGIYTYVTINQIEKIEPYRWGFTSLFGLMFLLIFLDKYKKL